MYVQFCRHSRRCCHRCCCLRGRDLLCTWLSILYLPLVLSTKVEVIAESPQLDELSACVCCVAGQEEVVAWLDAPCEAREDERVRGEGGGHGARDDFFVLFQVGNGREWETPVCASASDARAERVPS